jgi:hypothetical protein
MRRREILAGLTGAAASLLPARAQQRIPVIGFLSSASADQDAGRLRGFRQGLSEMGYVEGRNVAVEYGGVMGRAQHPHQSFVGLWQRLSEAACAVHLAGLHRGQAPDRHF